MKKFILSFAVIAAIGFTSCSSDDDGDGGGASCESLSVSAQEASEAYLADLESAEKCNDFKNALQAVINADCGTAEELEDVQASLEFLTCE